MLFKILFLTFAMVLVLSIQFVEIKGSLFKRMDKNNLLQISCSDVKERFQYSVLLFVVFVRNMTEFNWNPGKNLVLWLCYLL